MKRVLVCGDLHCGNVVGLTPPEYQWNADTCADYRKTPAIIQRETWAWAMAVIDKLRPIDILVLNGDLIDGKGAKSGGTEIMVSDRHEQGDMAVRFIDEVKAPKKIILVGTGYHTGDEEDFEDVIAKDAKADKISGHEWLNINNCMFDIKHHIGGSGIPHGRFGAIAREKLWNDAWSLEENGQPNADVLIRSHVHYFGFCGTERWLGITMPALQGFGSKYGIRRCSGIVNIGMVHFDIEDDGGYKWQPHLLNHEFLKAQPLVL